MWSDNEQMRTLLARAEEAAAKASVCIMDFYGKDLAVWDKGIGTHTGDCVTEADHRAQELIFDVLFPNGLDNDPVLHDVAVLAEEMPDHGESKRFDKDYVFLIDPLDGTRGFLDHTNSFATSIGLVRRDGTPVFGVVELPAYRRRYVAVAGRSCEENGRPLELPELGDELVLLVSEAEIFAADKNAVWHRLTAALKTELGITKIRPQVIGSPVHKGAYTVACGAPALYLGLPRAKKGVSLWDLAAIASVVDGAGGAVSDVYGDPLELNRADSIYAHHKGFLFASHKAVADVVVAALGREAQIVF